MLKSLEEQMLARLTELNNGQPVRVDLKTPPLERICRVEKAIQVLEARKATEEEEEAARLKQKMAELQSSLATTTAKKKEQREHNRRTLTFEIDQLRIPLATMALPPLSAAPAHTQLCTTPFA